MVTEVRDVPALPERPRDGHKGSFGTVLILAGSHGMLGAAILAARGALRGGAGLVRCALPEALMAPLTVAVPAATTCAREGSANSWFAKVDAVVCGPGLATGPDARAIVAAVFERDLPAVLDADGLNLCAPLASPLPGPASSRVLTPHPGEAARLLETDTEQVQRDRRAAALEVSRRAGGTVCVLKGAATVVTDGERLYENTSGNAGLATGGSGDVLSGLLGALLAQGMAPFDAARLGVFVHGRAGDRVAARLSEAGLCAEDLPLAIAEELRP